jgi:cytidylate kinase
MAKFVVAIDGGAGSGKSTTAKAVAKRLKFFYLDTGAMYRAATLKYLRCGGSTDNIDTALVREIIKHTVINLRQEGSKILVFLDNKDVTLEIRTTPVNNFVSPISALPEIREWMVQKQREVMQADLKIRAQRRQKELDEKNIEADFNKVVENLKFLDKYDLNRVHSPLKKAEDAIILDTTDITIEQEIDFVEKIVRERLKEIPKIQNT